MGLPLTELGCLLYLTISISEVMAELRCDVDTAVSRNQVCRSSQYGVIERKSTGGRGSGGTYMTGGFGTVLVDANRIFALHIGGRESCYPECPTQTIPSGKHGYLSADKVRQIEYWLAKVDPGSDNSAQ